MAPYIAPVPAYARLRSRAAFERQMQHRNLNASELAKLSDTTRQKISNLRTGRISTTRQDSAIAIERALRVERGTLFDYNHQAKAS